MDEVDFILRTTIFEKHTVDVILMCHEGKIEFEIDMNSYGRKNQVDFGLNGPNNKWAYNNNGLIGPTPRNSWGG